MRGPRYSGCSMALASDPVGSARVRPAIGADAAAIARIYSESIRARDSTMDTEPVTAAETGIWLERLTSRETLLVVENEGAVRGWGIVKKYSDRTGYREACETSVYLERKWTRRGLGSLVQRHLMDFCRSAGYHHLVAKVWADNEGSAEMHRRFGYELVGVQREIGLVDGKRRDVAIFQCLLDPD